MLPCVPSASLCAALPRPSTLPFLPRAFMEGLHCPGTALGTGNVPALKQITRRGRGSLPRCKEQSLESGKPKPDLSTATAWQVFELVSVSVSSSAKLDDNFYLSGLHRQRCYGLGSVQVTPLPSDLDVASCSPDGGPQLKSFECWSAYFESTAHPKLEPM